MIESIDGLIVIPGLTEPALGAHVGPNATLKRYIECNVPLRHKTVGTDQYLLKLWATRKSADPMTSSDGVDEGIGYFRVDNEADNASYCRQRVVRMRCRNNSGAGLYHMKGLEIEMDNRGTVTGANVGLRIWMKNLAASTIGGGIRAIEIEMGEQAPPTGHHRAIDLRHNDPSSVTQPTAIVVRSDRATNGFAFAIDVQSNGIAQDGSSAATSAFVKIEDDGENADLANATSTILAVIKVVVGTTVGYLAVYTSYTAS